MSPFLHLSSEPNETAGTSDKGEALTSAHNAFCGEGVTDRMYGWSGCEKTGFQLQHVPSAAQSKRARLTDIPTAVLSNLHIVSSGPI